MVQFLRQSIACKRNAPAVIQPLTRFSAKVVAEARVNGVLDMGKVRSLLAQGWPPEQNVHKLKAPELGPLHWWLAIGTFFTSLVFVLQLTLFTQTISHKKLLFAGRGFTRRRMRYIVRLSPHDLAHLRPRPLVSAERPEGAAPPAKSQERRTLLSVIRASSTTMWGRRTCQAMLLP